MLRDWGLFAVKTEHNDILVDGMKVSGNACYALSTGTIVHGTLLVDVDFEMLQQAITPSVEKLAKHGVKSVRQRVTNIAEKIEYTMSDVEQKITNALCTRTRTLNEKEIEQINAIEQTYLNPIFIQGK